MPQDAHNSPKRTIANKKKQPIEINLDALTQAVANLRAESTAAHAELMALQDDESKVKALLNAMDDQLWFCDTEGDLIYANAAALAWVQDDLGQPYMNWRTTTSICSVDGVPCDPENAPLLRALQGEEVHGEMERLKHPISGEFVYHEVNAIPVQDAKGKVIGAVANIRDVTERYKADRQTRILHDLMIAVAEASAVPEVAEITLEQCLQIFAVAVGCIILYSEDERVAKVIAESGLADMLGNVYAISPEALNILSQGESLVDPVAQFPEFYQEVARRFGMQAILSLPLAVRQKSLGSIVIVFDEPVPISQEDHVFYRIVANYCAQALDRIQLYEQAQAEALVQERQRFARDLHDSVTQSLYTTSVMAQVLLKQKETISHDVLWEYIERINRLTTGSLAQMRNLLLEMRPEHWEAVSVKDILNQLANATMGNAPIDIKVSLAESLPNIPTDIRIALYFITHEALNNITKHAGARHAEIMLEQQANQMILLIRDDGRGFNVEEVRPGMGLGNIRDRVQEIGADLNLKSSPESGTQIEVRINL